MVALVGCVALHRPSQLLAVGFDSGSLDLHAVGTDGVSNPRLTTLAALHAGGILCAAFSSDGSLLLTSGTDGRIQFIECELMGSKSAALVGTVALVSQDGATSGAEGLHIESIVADGELWLAPVGKRIAVGRLSRQGDGIVQYVGPLHHAIDAVQLLPALGSGDGGIAAASFGGVSLWRHAEASGTGDASDGACVYVERAPRLCAARCSHDGDLACDGWARSLVSSPDGEWLASWVMIAGDEPTKLWLWRTSDGADFECGGFSSPLGICALAWRADSHALCSCCGAEALVWAFPQPYAPSAEAARGGEVAARRAQREGPAGRAPLKFQSGNGHSPFLSAAFSPDGFWLACGTADGHVLLFAANEAAGTQAASGRVPHAQYRWALVSGGLGRASPVEHLLWVTDMRLLASGPSMQGVATWEVARHHVDRGELFSDSGKRPLPTDE